MQIREVTDWVSCENCGWTHEAYICSLQFSEARDMVQFHCPDCGQLLALAKVEIRDLEILRPLQC